VVLCDGHSSHLTLDVLVDAHKRGIHIVCRPPHTSHKSQPEDVVNFAVFKPKWFLAVGMLHAQRIFAKGGYDPASKLTDDERRRIKTHLGFG
jgi:hypothetical protein